MHSLGDEGCEEVVLEEAQEVEIVDEPPPKPIQGKPLTMRIPNSLRMH